MKALIELVFIAILVVSVWGGYKKGLVMTVGSILIIIISLFIGDLLSDTFSREAVPVLRPFISGYMEGEKGAIETSLFELTGDEAEIYSMDDILEIHPELKQELCQFSYAKMGVYSSTAEKMTQQAVAYYDQGGVSMSYAIVEIMCENLTYYIGFILFFAVAVILLTVLGNISNLSFKIPGMDKLNSIGGAVLGIVVGILYCALAAWMLKFAGKLLPEEALGSLTKLFVHLNTLSRYLSI